MKYVPALQAYDAAHKQMQLGYGFASEHLEEAAHYFIDANPECPYNITELVSDFMKCI